MDPTPTYDPCLSSPPDNSGGNLIDFIYWLMGMLQ